jgi:hypothetical protein
MLFELRTYDLKPGRATAYLEQFRTAGVGLVSAHLPLLGYWMTESGRLNRIEHLWAYADFAERAECRVHLAADTEWMQGFIPTAFVDVVAQQNRFLRLLDGSTAFDSAVAARRTTHPNQSADTPMFVADCQALAQWPGEAPAVAGQLARFEVISGNDVGQQISLAAGEMNTLLTGYADAEWHEVIRPLTLSPLR